MTIIRNLSIYVSKHILKGMDTLSGVGEGVVGAVTQSKLFIYLLGRWEALFPF